MIQFPPYSYKLFLLNRHRLIMIKPLTALAMLALLPTLAFAQHSHTGRVTRSFTEPIQRNIVASTESGVTETLTFTKAIG